MNLGKISQHSTPGGFDSLHRHVTGLVVRRAGQQPRHSHSPANSPATAPLQPRVLIDICRLTDLMRSRGQVTLGSIHACRREYSTCPPAVISNHVKHSVQASVCYVTVILTMANTVCDVCDVCGTHQRCDFRYFKGVVIRQQNRRHLSPSVADCSSSPVVIVVTYIYLPLLSPVICCAWSPVLCAGTGHRHDDRMAESGRGSGGHAMCACSVTAAVGSQL